MKMRKIKGDENLRAYSPISRIYPFVLLIYVHICFRDLKLPLFGQHPLVLWCSAAIEPVCEQKYMAVLTSCCSYFMFSYYDVFVCVLTCKYECTCVCAYIYMYDNIFFYTYIFYLSLFSIFTCPYHFLHFQIFAFQHSKFFHSPEQISNKIKFVNQFIFISLQYNILIKHLELSTTD